LDCKRLLQGQKDPIEEARNQKAQARLEAACGLTFQQCSHRYLQANSGPTTSIGNCGRRRLSDTPFLSSALGQVQQISQSLIMEVLEPLWASKTETASSSLAADRLLFVEG
jgi:hypothetical protein